MTTRFQISAILACLAAAAPVGSEVLYRETFTAAPVVGAPYRWYYYPLTPPADIDYCEHKTLATGSARGCMTFFDKQAWQLPWADHQYLESRGDWWSDPNHETPLNIIAFAQGFALDLRNVRVGARMKTELTLPLKGWTNAAGETRPGHLHFWLQTAPRFSDGTPCVNPIVSAPAWQEHVTYDEGHLVTYAGDAYKCLSTHISGSTTLPTSNSHWELKGKCKWTDYVFSKVNIEETPGIDSAWTSITLDLTSNPADWTCLGCWNGGAGRVNTCGRYRASTESFGIADDLKQVEAIGFMDGTTRTGHAPVTSFDPTDLDWRAVGLDDFNNDGKHDIVWRHQISDANKVWFMNGTVQSGVADLPALADTNWRIVATGDLSGDGRPDLLWRNESSGANYIWVMNGTAWVSGAAVAPLAQVDWRIVGLGDFNADGSNDIVWRDRVRSLNYVWYMRSTTRVGGDNLPSLANTDWRIVSVVDRNGDSRPDLLWRHQTTGENYIWFMDGTAVAGGASITSVPDVDWAIVPADY